MILAKREKDNSWAGLAMLTQGEQWGSVVHDGGGVDDEDGGHDVNHMMAMVVTIGRQVHAKSC